MTTPTLTHIEDEELMAFAEGELPQDETQEMEAHLLSCQACAARLSAWREEADALGATLQSWTTVAAPARVEHMVLGALAARESGSRAPASARSIKPKRWLWWLTVAPVAALILVLVIMPSAHRTQPFTVARDEFKTQESLSTLSSENAVPPPPAPAMKAPQPGGVAGMMAPAFMDRPSPAPPVRSMQAAPAPMESKQKLMPKEGRSASASSAPMIARTATLAITVDSVDRARVVVEGLLGRYGGYAAQMQVSTPVEGARILSASLRVPAAELPQALADLKTLGHVASESQSGEEVGQDHADLQARLNTARGTEDRLRGILRDRTGSVSDVLEVEEQIATTREQIESMEAQLDGLEHRVRYATIELHLNERPTHEASRTAAGRLGDSIAAGWHNVGDLLLGLILWLAEYGPSIFAVVLLALLLGLPGVWLWRRSQKTPWR